MKNYIKILFGFCAISTIFMSNLLGQTASYKYKKERKIEQFNHQKLKRYCATLDISQRKEYYVRMEYGEMLCLEYDNKVIRKLNMKEDLSIMERDERNSNNYVVNRCTEIKNKQQCFYIINYYTKTPRPYLDVFVIYDVKKRKVVKTDDDEMQWLSFLTDTKYFFINKKDNLLHFFTILTTPNDDSNIESLIEYKILLSGKVKLVGEQQIRL